MTDKIKFYLEDRLKRLEDIKNKREWTTAELGDATCCKQTLAFINSLQEEPVSKKDYKCPKCGGHMTIDMSAKTASVKPMYYLRCDNCRYLDFVDCDEVEKEEPVSEDLGEYINKLSKQFPEVSFAKLSRIVFRVVKWKEKQMMSDATEAVVAIDSGGYPYIDKTIELYDYDKDVPLAKEGDKYKVILIKEE